MWSMAVQDRNHLVAIKYFLVIPFAVQDGDH
jgi:hypothetical protein